MPNSAVSDMTEAVPFIGQVRQNDYSSPGYDESGHLTSRELLCLRLTSTRAEGLAFGQDNQEGGLNHQGQDSCAVSLEGLPRTS